MNQWEEMYSDNIRQSKLRQTLTDLINSNLTDDKIRGILCTMLVNKETVQNNSNSQWENR